MGLIMSKECSVNQTFSIRKIGFLVLAIFFELNTFSQEIDCKKLKDGIFYAEVSEPTPIKWQVTREGNSQVEQAIESDDGKSNQLLYEIIEWIDDCTYRLKYDSTRFELNPMQRMINDNGGALNQIIGIEGNCHYYKSTIKINGIEQSMEGKLCRIE